MTTFKQGEVAAMFPATNSDDPRTEFYIDPENGAGLRMKQEFKIGDTVALKSGGAAMTISDIDGDFAFVEITWTDESGKWRQEEAVPVECLTPITRKAIHIDEATIRYIWVFAESGEPLADHIALRAPAGEAPACRPTCGQDVL